jgi:hypothetical protein
MPSAKGFAYAPKPGARKRGIPGRLGGTGNRRSVQSNNITGNGDIFYYLLSDLGPPNLIVVKDGMD